MNGHSLQTTAFRKAHLNPRCQPKNQAQLGFKDSFKKKPPNDCDTQQSEKSQLLYGNDKGTPSRPNADLSGRKSVVPAFQGLKWRHEQPTKAWPFDKKERSKHTLGEGLEHIVGRMEGSRANALLKNAQLQSLNKQEHAIRTRGRRKDTAFHVNASSHRGTSTSRIGLKALEGPKRSFRGLRPQVIRRKKVNLTLEELSRPSCLQPPNSETASVVASESAHAPNKASRTRTAELTISHCFSLHYKEQRRQQENPKRDDRTISKRLLSFRSEEQPVTPNYELSADERLEVTRSFFISRDSSVSTRSILRQKQNGSSSEKHVSFDESFNQEFVVDCEFKGISPENRASSLKAEKKAK